MLSEEVDVSVDDTVNGNVKSELKVRNTGISDGYIRVAVIGCWTNLSGDVVASWQDSDGAFAGMMGADDIFATGNSTTVNLPKVSTMTLIDYSAPVDRLYWVEDYMVDDTGYANGTNKINDGGGVMRYRSALTAGSDRYFVMDEAVDWSGSNFNFKNKYLSLALGYTLLYITIEKSGMQGNDNAIFTITKKGETSPYAMVVLSEQNTHNGVVIAADGTKTLSKRISVPEGEWIVQEVDDWTWAYQNNTGAITRQISSLTLPADRIFRFSNTKTTQIPHAESIKINILNK